MGWLKVGIGCDWIEIGEMKNNEEHGERVSFIGSLAAVECK